MMQHVTRISSGLFFSGQKSLINKDSDSYWFRLHFIYLSLNKNLNVILDATHVREKYINAIIEEFKYEADIDYQLFDISLNKAVERDAAREKKVGPEVIKKMYESYKVLIDSFHFQPHKKLRNRPVIKPNFKSELPNAVIFDIDGTLAIMGNRSPFEWDKVDRDSLNEIVAD